MMYEIEKNRKYGYENDNNASLTCYLNSTLKAVGRRYRMAMIILPGGGYGSIQEREGEPIAIRYMGYGVQCFVLQYSITGSKRYKDALNQVCESIAFIRKNAEKWDIDPNRIVLCGFSAGGHLAASVGCYNRKLSEWIGYNIRPNALMLGYPVITSSEYAHRESIINCMLDNEIYGEEISLEKHIGEDFPPTYIWACNDDAEVSVQNALSLAVELTKRNISNELHVFANGGHGASLGDECTARIESQINDHYAKWFELSLAWLQGVV